MSLFNLLFGTKPKSAVVAKERLKIILAHERTGRSLPDFLPALQKDLVDVISRYVAIRPEDIKVSVDKHENYEVLEVNIVLPENRVAESA